MAHSRKIFLSLFLSLSALICAPAGAQTPTPTPNTTGLRLNGSSPSGMSSYTPVSTNGTTTTIATIYGGYTGAVGGCAAGQASSGSTCSSCSGTLGACNLTSIHTGLYLTVPLISNTVASFQNSPVIRYTFGSSSTNFRTISNTPTLAAGQAFNAQILWSTLCGSATAADVNCTTSFSDTLTIGIMNSGGTAFLEQVTYNIIFRYVASAASIVTPCVPPTVATATTIGICGFSVGKGDSKIYINTLDASSNGLETDVANLTYNRLVLFYEKGSTAATTTVTASSPSVILNLQNNSPNEPSISDPRIQGLDNGTKYCFVLGNMDQTGIISNFPDPTVLSTTCATPEPVVGLLDDKHCFVATATFGSDMAPEVVTFRQFRNEFLLTNSGGRAFVKNYYKYGPIAANWISQSPLLKSFSLAVLWPLLIFAKLSLALGVIPALLMALLGVLGMLTVASQFRRSRELRQ